MYKNDNLVKNQLTLDRLPLPRDLNVARTLNLMSGYNLRRIDETYGIVYASDVDKINVEFSEDLVQNGYFVLKSGDNVVAKEVIKDRVTTFNYAFNENLLLEYGYLSDITLPEEEILKGSNLEEVESVLIGINDIKTDIMVYKNDYYYISENGIVSSVGTWNGNFVNLMNGKALDIDGNIWNVETKKKEGTVTGLTTKTNKQALWSFLYAGIEIDTYAKFSAIQSEYSSINRNSQIFVVNEQLFTVDGSLETRKTDILIYKLNGEQYQTILGNDGFMVDMMQEEVNIPKEVDNQAIVRMSNTLDASVSYVLIEYNDGGIIGYNYATGEILFDNSIQKQVSILDYAMEFFGEKKDSQYANISNTYLPNADLSKKIHSTDDLAEVLGHSSGELITNNSTGEDTGAGVGQQAMADANNAQAGTGTIGSGDPEDGQGLGEESSEAMREDISGTTSVLNGIEGDEGNEITNGDNPEDGQISGEETSIDSEKTTVSEEQKSDEAKDDKSDDTSLSDTQNTDNVNKTNGSSKPPVPMQEELAPGEFMTVYNNETGVYEIVSVAKYLTEDAYYSENHSMGIKDLSKEVASGYAVSTMDVNQERGIIIYIIPICIIFGIVGGIVVYFKRKERNA